MRNIVGQPVSGDDYFPREGIINLIYRRLAGGSHLFMAAPRRVGKTSIMYYLRDQPRAGYAFIYVPTESVDGSELYFKRLFEALLNSEAIGSKVKKSAKAKGLLENITKRIKSISVFGVEMALENPSPEKYADLFLELMKKLDYSEIKIVMMIDEFPSTVENIHQKSKAADAVHFLKLNRTMRQESAGGIQFIYTGSIGLPAIVNRLDTPESINDLNQVEIPPLDTEEGKRIAVQLLDSANVTYNEEAIDYLLEKINWLMPFFIQLSVQELIDLYDQNQTTISKKIIDVAFDRICNRRNNIHFDSYYNRLEDTFSREDYELALLILNLVAQKDEISKEDLLKETETTRQKRNIHSVLESLVYDGYINLQANNYRFNSPILQLWWNKYIQN
jgi:uncharacterized protein